MKKPTEMELQNLADTVAEAFGNEIVETFDGFREIVKNFDHLTTKEKAFARKYLHWDILTDAETEVLNQWRKQFAQPQEARS